MNQPIQMIAIDIDGTLLDDEYRCDPDTIDYLHRLQNEGVHILLCTGRPLRTTLHMAKELGISTYLITDNGAVIHQMDTSQPLMVRQFSPDIYQKMIPVLEQSGLHLDVTSLNGMYALPHTPDIGEMYRKYLAKPTVLSSMSLVTDEIVKATLFAQPESINEAMERLPVQLHHLPVQCFRSGPTFIDVMHVESSKGNALHFLSHHLGIERRNVMAIGNYYNDIDMIRFAGVGVAMENAPSEVQTEADYITASNNHQGVKKALQKFL